MTAPADLMMFAVTGMNVSQRFDGHPEVAEVLRDDSSTRERFGAKLARISKIAWTEVESERPAVRR
jgi:hypothetical protein